MIGDLSRGFGRMKAFVEHMLKIQIGGLWWIYHDLPGCEKHSKKMTMSFDVQRLHHFSGSLLHRLCVAEKARKMLWVSLGSTWKPTEAPKITMVSK